MRRGVEQLRDAYARNGLTFDQFTGSRYLRINRVSELQEAGRLDDELRWRLPVGAGDEAAAPIRAAGAVIFNPARLAGAFLIDVERHEDERGFLARTFCEREFAEHGAPMRIVQSSTIHSPRPQPCAACTTSWRRMPK